MAVVNGMQPVPGTCDDSLQALTCLENVLQGIEESVL